MWRVLMGVAIVALTALAGIVGVRAHFLPDPRLHKREVILRDDLFTMRSLIDQYTLDKQRAPQSLDDLVQSGYLKEIPVDPFTNSRNTWTVVQEDVMQSMDKSQPGMTDVHSGSRLIGSDGRPYSDW